jgi:spore maturation protein CgeB
MRILMVHPGPDFSVADVYRGWADALRKLGCEVAEFNTSDRFTFYSKVLLPSIDEHGRTVLDERGMPIVRLALNNDQEVIRLSMQGLTHAAMTFWPEVILYVSGFFIPDGMFELFRLRWMKQVMLHTESPYLPRGGAAAPGGVRRPEPAQRSAEHRRL